VILLILFSFLGGIVTILSPCILPLLPIILSNSIKTGSKRPMGIILGFTGSFTIFTLFLTTLVNWTGIPADSFRIISVLVIFSLGLSMLVPRFQSALEQLFSRLIPHISPGNSDSGFWGGLLTGGSLGLVWTPCVGPIMASVISLAISGSINSSAVFVTLAFSLGTAIPMLVVARGGRGILEKFAWLSGNTGKIQKVFGIVMMLTAISIYFGIDRRFQAYILEIFPSYGVGLTKLEDRPEIDSLLNKLKNNGLTLETANDQPIIAPELIPGGDWLNSPPLTLKDLKGKVVLIDFWTYTCINCIRTLPYLKSWHDKYKDEGLVIIGVHTPEFEFEKDVRNVRSAMDDYKILYPVMQDNNYATWNAYRNRYWPAKYLIDRTGKIRYTHFGEGKYDESEEMIQELLKEDGSQINEKIDNENYSIYSKTPELYLGASRMSFLGSPERISLDQETLYSYPKSLRENFFAFSGSWTVTDEYSSPKNGSKLKLKFQSKDVYLVIHSQNGEGKLKINLDGAPISQSHEGADVNNGELQFDNNRLYHLVRLDNAGSHEMEIEFLQEGMKLYAFTFG
jgi:cytochrome c biogenesis protein CcdA/thiol-disulfide isomerase/thioredoxin